MEFQSPLNDSCVAARRSDAAEIARVEDRSGSPIHLGGVTEVADGVAKIHDIQQVEEFGAELHRSRLIQWKAPGDGHVEAVLSWSAQDITAHVADISARCRLRLRHRLKKELVDCLRHRDGQMQTD